MLPLIPYPQEIAILEENFFELSNETTILCSKNCEELAFLVIDWIKEVIEQSLALVSKSLATNKASSIILRLDPTLEELGNEGYELSVSPVRLIIKASNKHGLFYGIQTFKQIIYVLNKGIRAVDLLKIPQIVIRDKPRFLWRGFMLDVGRHYQPVSTIKKILECMALLKMNVFHFHFNEDQGWRIEIKKFPELTSVGSKRQDTQIGGFRSKKFRGKPHSGYYSQREIREIVAYAKKLHISVVPELELPGHCSAALAAFPKLSCKEEEITVKTKAGIFEDIYCAGKESTFLFLKAIIDELIALFPSELFHIGGDEAPKKRWKNCPKCQARIQAEELVDEEELQVYFTNRISSYLNSKGKTVIGWNQILGDDLAPGTVVQWWMGKRKTKYKYLRSGYPFVMSDFFNTYMDYTYLFLPLRKYYNYDPIPTRLEKKYHDNILGVEAPLWTEWVPNLERLGWQLFPRLLAIAEVAWTEKKNKNFRQFKQRVETFYSLLDYLGLPYASLMETDPGLLKRLLNIRDWFKWPDV